MSKNKYNPIEEKHVTRKEFSYTKNDITLNFKLRTDIKNELKDFKDLLEKALQDVIEEIERKLP